LPGEVGLSPHAAERVCREAAQKSFDDSARSLAIDWHRQTLDGKQVQRWAQAVGKRMVQQRDKEVREYQQGRRPGAPANGPVLLVVGVDGGCYQSREKDPQTASRWRGDKVCTVTSYLPGDGREEGRKPEKLVTTHVATTQDCHAFGPMARVEAERRGIRNAEEVIFMCDCGNWIDPLHDRHFDCHPRIADYHHAEEHLWDVARAVVGSDSPKVPGLAGRLSGQLYDGKVDKVIRYLEEQSSKLGPAQPSDGAHHPRRVLQENAGYFQRNKDHMDYPAYRARGWPIGSGNTEAGVKQFNKRVKGTDQFWSEGIEAILALRGMWTSQDDRWNRHWATRPAYESN
jgi:hypothetical protein